ncbi:unnamed protein product (macronuclear) [Paramecium tetraurelia]|uniref:Uncharacterized protein n=1 Tax=Paramecium tetraurelia TaxID=5888 RepID=A0CRJ0_PARTE|nr:uncharacterized protein GSPATT00009722001 [Paramecium tetraurelia]CAK73407.1 unnamed protein product [Paramecium tetraurelia]|eukprot:XP_001440804.1 hypothetical protein (macronuclear) [Paramecium tetraurelia strain d4-2]
MKRQKKSTTTVDIYYMECQINKLIRSNTNNSIHPQSLKHHVDTQLNIPKRSTLHKHNPVLIENKIQASTMYQKKSLHIHARPISEDQTRKFHPINMEELILPQRSNLIRQIKNQMMFPRQQWSKQENIENRKYPEIFNPLKISRKPIKTFSINLKSSFKQVSNTSRLNTGLNLSNQRNFSPMRTMTERPNVDLTGWQTTEDVEWV